jgi:hypothetical protein
VVRSAKVSPLPYIFLQVFETDTLGLNYTAKVLISGMNIPQSIRSKPLNLRTTARMPAMNDLECGLAPFFNYMGCVKLSWAKPTRLDSILRSFYKRL